MKTTLLNYMAINVLYTSPARHLQKIVELAELDTKEVTSASITFVTNASKNHTTTYNITPRHFTGGCDIDTNDFYATKITRENGRIITKVDTRSSKNVFIANSISDLTIWFDTLKVWISTMINPTNGEPLFILHVPPKKPDSFSDDPYVCGYCGSLFVYEVPSEDKEGCSAFFCEHCDYVSLRAEDAKHIKLYLKHFKEGKTYV